MADTYTQALKARKIEPGAYDPDWSERFNEDVVDILDAGISGQVTIDIGSNTTYTLAAMVNGTLSDSHYWRLNIIGTPASAVTFTIPASVTPSKEYLIDNQTGQAVTVKYAATAGVTVQDGDVIRVLCDGTTVTELSTRPRFDITAAEIAAPANPLVLIYEPGDLERYGFSTSKTAAQNSAIFAEAASVVQKLRLWTPGTYNTDGLVGVDHLDFEGAGAQFVTINVSSGNTGLQLYGDVPPAFTAMYTGIHIRGMRFAQSDKSGIGLDLYSVARSQFGNVEFVGFNYGLKTRTSFPLAFYGMVRFTEGNIGWKAMPINGTDSLGTNAISFGTLDVRANVVAGISIAGCNAIDIQTLLGEGNPVIGYIKEGVQCLDVGVVYVEPGSAVSSANRRKNRAGVLTPFTWVIGADESGVSSGAIVENGSSADPNRLLRLGREVDSFGGSPSYVANIDGVRWDMAAARGYVILGQNVKGYEADTLQGDDALSSSIIAGIGRNVPANTLRRWTHNLIPNGNFAYPSLPLHTFTTATISAQTLNGQNKRCMVVTLANAATSVVGSFFARLPGGMFASSAEQFYATIHCKATSTDIASVKIELLDSNGTSIASKTLTADFTSWRVISCADNVNTNINPNPGVEVKITVTRTTGTGAQSLYIDEVVCAPVRSGVLQQGPQDLMSGFCFTGTCSVSDSGRYYVEFDSGLGDPTYFRVIATAQGTAAGGDLSVVKPGGGDSGKFRVYSATNGMVVEALVIPLLGVAP